MKALRIILALELILAGCGTTPKKFPPADITKEDTQQIEKPALEEVDQEVFDKKISEIKGKTRYFHAGDTVFSVIYTRADQLSQWQDGIRIDNNGRISAWVVTSTLAAPLVCILFVPGASTNSSTGGDNDGNISGLLWLVTVPLQLIAGGVIGYLVGEMATGPNILDNQKTSLLQLIDDYNFLTTQKATPDSLVQYKHQ